MTWVQLAGDAASIADGATGIGYCARHMPVLQNAGATLDQVDNNDDIAWCHLVTTFQFIDDDADGPLAGSHCCFD